MIICASRRTDIPAFHSEWMMNRLRAGSVLVRNPMSRNLVHRIDLSRSNVDCIVFITKDPGPMVPYLREIGSMGHMYVFQVTLIPYGRSIEPGVRSKGDINDSCIEISDRIGRDRMSWRYDLVIFNGTMGLEYHRRKFIMLCGEASKWTDRCIFSFVDTYGKLSRFQEQGVIRSMTKQEMLSFARMASKVSDEYGISLTHCCSKLDLEEFGIQRRGCLDKEMMRSLNIPYETMDTPLREGCRCVKSIDIGEYDTCDHGCIYCYANRSDPTRRLQRIYDPDSEILWGEITQRDSIKELSPRAASRLGDFL